MLGFPGASTPAAPVPTPEEVESLSTPPADLRPGRPAPGIGDALLPSEADYWRRFAPAAIEQRTLTAATLHGFRELCELAAFKEEIAARVAKYGSDGKTGTERMRTYTRLSQRLDAALARFKLTAFGKPADGGGAGSKRPVANPFAQLGG